MSRRVQYAQKQKWTEEEEAALRAGVAKYDVGKWRYIQKDEDLGPILANRSNVDLKDKWRNLNMDSSGARRPDRRGSDRGSRRKRKRRARREEFDDEDDDEVDEEEAVLEEMASRADERRRATRRAARGESLSPPNSPAAEEEPPGPLMSPDELVMTAIISLQDNPEGTHVDDIVRYLEGQYGAAAASKRMVKATLRSMAEAGRLLAMEASPGCYRLAGVARKLLEEASRWPDAKAGAFLDDRTAKEAAEAAAKAVAEAELAAQEAAQLLAVAEEYDLQTGSDGGGRQFNANGEDGFERPS